MRERAKSVQRITKSTMDVGAINTKFQTEALIRAFGPDGTINLFTPFCNVHDICRAHPENSQEFCNKQLEERPRSATDQPLHTHHIKEQHLADAKGMIDGIHKNATSNLMVLCHQCHNKVHAT